MSSVAFLELYAALCLATWIANVLAWRLAGGTAGASQPPRQLGVYEVALLNGGASLAITTAVTALHCRGVLCEGWIPGTLAVSGAWDRDEARLEPIERELVTAARRAGEISPAALERELTEGVAIREIVAQLTSARLIVDARHVVWMRLLYLSGPPVLAALGAIWFASASSEHNDRPTRWVGLLAIGAVLTTIDHVVTELQHAGSVLPTRGGAEIVRRRREASGSDVPRDGARVAWDVALTGPWALWSSAPGLAAHLGAPPAPVSLDAERSPGSWSCG